MNEKELLQFYVEQVKQLKESYKKDLTDKEMNKIFEECFALLDPPPKVYRSWLKIYIFLFLFLLLGSYVLMQVHQPTSSIVLRNVQGLIYPGLKFVRFLSMPIIKHFSSLTELYDESCLLENPYFYVNNMECWPCENVYSVINATELENQSIFDSGSPFITNSNQGPVYFKDIQSLYYSNKMVIDQHAGHVKSNKNISYVENLLELEMTESSDTHISWRINRMLPAQIIRSLFPRPRMISEWSGQSIERYVMIDGPKSEGFTLPNFECSYVSVTQGSGERTVVLKPTKECGHKCRSISVILKENYTLWYNWWYWRPISLPIQNSTNVSVSYITSYC